MLLIGVVKMDFIVLFVPEKEKRTPVVGHLQSLLRERPAASKR